MVIEEGVIPGALQGILPTMFEVVDAFEGQPTERGFLPWVKHRWRAVVSWVWSWFGRGREAGSLEHTQTLLVMSHDGADGALTLDGERITVNWPGVADKPAMQSVDQRLKQVAEALRGTHLANPIWSKTLGHNLVSVHPLGGCPMGDDAERGVVNGSGCVFSGSSGKEIHRGLYVTDGSVIPRSLGVNPLLTISALAERTCEKICDDRHWTIDWSPRRPAQSPGIERLPGLTFTEVMAGFVSRMASPGESTSELGAFQQSAEQGRTAQTDLRFVFTIHVDGMDQFTVAPEHAATLFGTVSCSLLSREPLTASQGKFSLFVVDPERVETKEMRYQARLHSIEGQEYEFVGFKRIHDDAGIDAWSDTSTLHVTITPIGDGSASGLRGILQIAPSDFVKQLLTVKVTESEGTLEAIKTQATFGRFFAGAIVDSFGKGLADEYVFDPHGLPRQHRSLNVGTPEVHFVKTEDGQAIRLTRYAGGKKGPVILSPGLGVSSLIFAIDTIDTNLLEYLYAHEYDVWLLDYRTSIELNSSQAPFTGDHIARFDYPAAVDFVRHATGSKSVQILAHCFGATTLSMAILNGLEGVRSVVLSQVGIDVETGGLTRMKAGLYIPDVLQKLGVQTMTAYVDTDRTWLDRLYDKALKSFYPIEREERARSPVHRRITFLYGTLYELDQLNDATFRALHEMFGIVNIAALDHLATIVRAGRIVNAQGDDVYAPQINRWNMPTLMIHGEENACFKPNSTLKTLQRLKAAHPTVPYTRKVIPLYGHIDCIFGKHAARDVYPHILSHFEQTASQ